MLFNRIFSGVSLHRCALFLRKRRQLGGRLLSEQFAIPLGLGGLYAQLCDLLFGPFPIR